jgi:hypothetical protein
MLFVPTNYTENGIFADFPSFWHINTLLFILLATYRDVYTTKTREIDNNKVIDKEHCTPAQQRLRFSIMTKHFHSTFQKIFSPDKVCVC